MPTQITGTSIATPTLDLTTPLAVADGGTGTLVAFSAYQNVAQSIPNGSWTKCSLNTEEYDVGSYFDNTTNYRFTPLVAGYYSVTGSIAFNAFVSTAITRVGIYKNGTTFKLGSQLHGSTTKIIASNVSSLVYMNGSTDYLELWVYQDTGSAQNTRGILDQDYFQAILVRAS